jgi:hypothetical protein
VQEQAARQGELQVAAAAAANPTVAAINATIAAARAKEYAPLGC